jgi:hypothetical protein
MAAVEQFLRDTAPPPAPPPRPSPWVVAAREEAVEPFLPANSWNLSRI